MTAGAEAREKRALNAALKAPLFHVTAGVHVTAGASLQARHCRHVTAGVCGLIRRSKRWVSPWVTVVTQCHEGRIESGLSARLE